MPLISTKDFFKTGNVTRVGSDGDNFLDLDDDKTIEDVWNKSKDQGNGFWQSLKNDLKERGKKIWENTEDIKNPLDLLESGYRNLGQVAGGVNDVIGNAAKEGFSYLPENVKKPIAETGNKVVTAVAKNDTVQKALQGYESWKTAHPDAAANLEATVNIASLLPIGKGFELAGKGAVKTAGNVAKGIVDPVAEITTKTGRAMKGTGKALYDTAITPSVKEAERLLQHKAQTPFLKRVSDVLSGVNDSKAPITRATTALDKGLVGRQTDLGVGAIRAEKKLWKETIEPALKGSKEKITKDDLFAPVIKRIEETIEPGKRKAYEEAFEAIKEEYADFIETSLIKGNKIKSDLDKFTPEKVFRGKPIGSEYTQLRADMASGIREKIYSSLKDKKIKRDFLDYSNLKELEQIGVKAISEKGKYGGFGTFWSSMWDMASTPIKTIGGRTLYKVGNKFEFIGDKGIKKFGDYLKSKGFESPNVGLSIKDSSKYNFTLIENGKKKTLKGLSREDLSDWIARANEQGLKYEVAAK